MLNRDQIELIHREIDGENTPEESAAFRSLIADNAEARVLEADLRHVTQVFDRVGAAEPPGHLRRAILDALPRQVPVISGWGSLKSAVQSIVDGLQKRPRFALVSSVCVGLVAGFGLYAAVAGTVVIDRSHTGGLTGTIIEPRAADGLETVHAVPIDVDGVSGRVDVKAGQTAVVVELESEVARTLEVRLTFAEGAYGLRGFSQLKSEAVPSFTAGPGLIRVTTSGANTQTFVLNHQGPVSPLALSLFDNGEEVFAATILPRGPDQGGRLHP
jgi:anti-sigma factor RsiW